MQICLCVKKTPTHHSFKGFEKSPLGSLLDQMIDMEHPMGVAYERSHGFFKDFHAHDRLIIIAPRGSCIMNVTLQATQKTFQINNFNILLVPKGIIHNDEGTSEMYDTFALLPSDELILSILTREGLSCEKIKSFMSSASLVKKSEWLDRLFQEYFLEKVVIKKMSSKALRLFEELIIMELFRLWSGDTSKSTDSKIDLVSESLEGNLDPITQKTLRYIEGNLFGVLSISNLALQIGVSPSSLRRHFSGSFGTGPQKYIRKRRLEEAAKLLANPKISIAEVATLVGYENFGSFSEAFKKQFGSTPSEYRKTKS